MRKASYLSLLGATLMIAGPMAMAATAASANANGQTDEIGNADLKATWLCGAGTSNEISIEGPLKIRGVGVSVKFEATGNRANVGYSDAIDGVDLQLSHKVTAMKSPRNQLGAGGNPWVFFQATASDKVTKVGDPILLGRCKGNATNSARVQARMAASIGSLVQLGGAGCSNKGSSVSANRSHGRSTQGMIILSNKLDLTGHTYEDPDVAVTDVSFAGMDPVQKRGNIESGVGGNPKVSVLLWKQKKNLDGSLSTSRPSDADIAAQTDIYSTVDDTLGAAKGWRFMGTCVDLK